MLDRRGLRLMAFAGCWALTWAGCGGGGSDSTSTTGVTGTVQAGEATVKSLASVPTVDLTTYDKSTSTSSSLSVPKSVTKGLGGDIGAVGSPSRAGCESNTHKKEMVRHSLAVALQRCYPEAMEQAGMITIPVGSFAHYSIVPPKIDATQQTGFCDDFPTEDTERKKACEADMAEGGSIGASIKLRIGVVDDKLQIDMCSGAAGAETPENEATFSASGSKHTASIIRIGKFGGATEKNSFDMTVDLGKTGTVTDGVPTIGTDGSVSAAGKMSGGYGSGAMTFELSGADSSNKITGAFAGEFTDPFSSTKTKFTGRAFSQFGGSSATGCAKYKFGGSMPPMRVDQMLPPFLGADQLANFLKTFAMQLGIPLTEANYKTTYLCPNDNFNPSDATSKPMIKANSDNTCPEVTDEGVECYSIKNTTVTATFGSKIEQTFTIIANSGSPYFDAVNAFDVAALDPSIGSLAFVRAWDCTGSFTPIDFAGLTPDQLTTIEKSMTKCFDLEEKAFSEDGAGGYNCHKEVMGDEINDSFSEGPPTQGKYGGEHSRTSGTCPTDQTAEKLYAETLNATTNEYCLNTGTATCQKFTVTSNNTTGLSLPTSVTGVTITGITYTQSGDQPATSANFTFKSGQGSCTMGYNISQPTFSKPDAYGGDPNVVPQACKDAGLTGPADEGACHHLCQETHKC